jgi:hypothetical protein
LVSDSFFGFGWCNCNPIPTRNKKSKSNKVTKFDDNYKRRLKTHGKDTLYFKYQNWQFVVQDSEIRTIELSDDKKIYNKKDVIEIAKTSGERLWVHIKTAEVDMWNYGLDSKFEFIDAQGGWIDFNWRFFKDEPLMKFTLTHNEICELPMGIVKHLNNTVKKVRKLGQVGNDGKVINSLEINSRVRFTPLEVL